MKKIISILMVSGLFATITNNVYAGYFITPTREACPQVMETNPSFGSASDEVLFMQNELKREGYFNDVPTGYFDNHTVEALKRFQRDNDLLQTGKVGPYTQDYLNQRICGFSLSKNEDMVAVGTTVVGSYDPFVKVVNAETDKYVATQNSTQGTGNTLNVSNNQSNYPELPRVVTPNTGTVITDSSKISYIAPATLINQPINNASIIYNPQIGYTYSVSPKAGSITMISPGANSVFHEGDSVHLSWYTTNLSVNAYRIVLKNITPHLAGIV